MARFRLVAGWAWLRAARDSVGGERRPGAPSVAAGPWGPAPSLARGEEALGVEERGQRGSRRPKLFITNDQRLSRKVVPGVHFIQSLATATL